MRGRITSGNRLERIAKERREKKTKTLQQQTNQGNTQKKPTQSTTIQRREGRKGGLNYDLS